MKAASALAGVVLAGALGALWIPTTLPAGDGAPAGMCAPGYARSHRLAPADYYPIARAAYARAGIPWSERAGYRLDHTKPLCLGGDWSPANLAVQTLSDAATKDRLEWRACEDVCAGRITYSQAVSWFTRDGWRDAYRRVFGGIP